MMKFFFILLKKMNAFLIKLIIFISILLLSACSKTPLQKLASDHLYPDLNSAYWAKEQSNKTSLWTEAVAYCQQNKEKPNCSAVMEVYVITNGSTEAPAIGHSGHPIHVP